ncbi:hypothetical protein WJX72_006459 [[Myrmecia] bisecta]|uniref:DNA topoisomerase (ATP-hydrolyzing) n=1 Tax=[Myrmecia] bisecta TaxID=41462 RepID=A0AAW1PXE8_9CHLO
MGLRLAWVHGGLQQVRLHTNTFGGPLHLQRSLHPAHQHMLVRGAARDAAAQASSNGTGAAASVVVPRVVDTKLQTEAEESYLAYAMSVIVGRALPDVRDGLKPVHRRILYAMHELGMVHNKPFRKCARVVGEVLGKYHPHGDNAVYAALVRLAQDFSMRAPLIDGHGNFGSLDNDPAAAMRYTECRLRSLTSAMLLSDLESDTVAFRPNFDASQEEPTVLPARIPSLLVNGSSGIAVGIATNIPPHNLREVVAGLQALIRNPGITTAELMQHIPAPDFPTGGRILATSGIRDAYTASKGSIIMRGRAAIEEEEASRRPGRAAKKRSSSSGKPVIIVTELPYQTNKATFVETIAKLVDSGVIVGVSDVRDESDRDGMRVVVEVKRGAAPEMVLNNLYKHTALQSRFSCNLVALVNGTPLSLNLKDFLVHFLDFRCHVVERRARFELAKAERRMHQVEGFLTALADLDRVVRTVRQAPDSTAAAAQLRADFSLSPEQAEGVLNMSLRRLTSLEAQKLQAEFAELQSRILDLGDLLGRRERVLQVVEAEALDVAAKYGDARRTSVEIDDDGQLVAEDVIPNQQSLILFSRRGYIKRMHADIFSLQRRGGTGKAGARLKVDDTVEEVVEVMDHDNILFFTADGIVRSIKAYEIPESSRTAVGTAITQVLPISKNDSIAAMLPVSDFAAEDYLVMLTVHGVIKKTPLSQFSDIRSSGITGMKLKAGDALMWVGKCRSTSSVLIASSNGQALHFSLDDTQLRPLGRASGGLVSMNLEQGATLVGMSILPVGPQAGAAAGASPHVLLVTAQGLGKRTPVNEFRMLRRGAKGVRAIKLQDGDRLAALHVVGGGEGAEEEEVLMGSSQGLMSRISATSIGAYSRAAKGVRVLRLQEGDEVQTVTPLRLQPEERPVEAAQP